MKPTDEELLRVATQPMIDAGLTTEEEVFDSDWTKEQKALVEGLKKLWNQATELAAEEAKLGSIQVDDGFMGTTSERVVDKQSILKHKYEKI